MAHFEEQKGGWPPHDSIAHLATHTPIQIPRPSEAPQGAFSAMHQGGWRRLPAEFGSFGNKTQPLFGSEWQAQPDWAANNNKLGDWDKWHAGTPAGNADVVRPMPKFAAMMPLSTALPVVTDNKPEDVLSIQPNPNYVSPKEDERKSSEHTNSYDVSASQSPSDGTDSRRGERTSEEPIDVECTASADDGEAQLPTNDHVSKMEDDDNQEDVKSSIICKAEEDSHLLLNFSQQSYNSAFDTSRLQIASPPVDDRDEKRPIGFSQSGTSAFSNIEPSSISLATSLPSTPATPSEKHLDTTPTNASFCRPPGLGPVVVPPPANGQAAPLVCPICGFSCPSKFHYNSHMNTHGDHQCVMCDYTSRTEGRLKKHMRESHTAEEQLRAGLELEPGSQQSTPHTPTSTATATIISTTPIKSESAPVSLSTTMASLLDSVTMAAAGLNNPSEVPQSLPSALSLDIASSPSLLNTIASGGLPASASALDQIRAFTENSSLMPGEGLNLASALGAVSQAITGSDSSTSPEKQSNSEPRRNSNGKVKVLKCKQCGHHSMSKDEQWAHARTHIPAEKQLNCQRCNFVTEYKHHLEYHYRNHIGSKPFICKKCSYACVNKSMLNSHMKSHTNHYQFRCMDCTYATKYCHSLKLHLNKYNHRRAPEGLGEMGDTSPTAPRPDIPSYPSFAGIKLEPTTPSTSLAQSLALGPIVTSQSLNYASQMLLRQHQEGMTPLLNLGGVGSFGAAPLKCPMCEKQCATQEEQLQHNMSHFLNQNNPITSLYPGLAQSMPSVIATVASMTSSNDNESMDTGMEDHDEHDEHEGSGHAGDDEMDHSSICADSPTGSSKGSGDEEQQKRKAFKLDQISQRLQGKSPSSIESCEEKEECHIESSVSPSEPLASTPALPIPLLSLSSLPSLTDPSLLVSQGDANPLNAFFTQAALALNVLQAKPEEGKYRFHCQHCQMGFQDQTMYHIHMGYHGYEQVFKCNRCGYLANDAVAFNIHLLQTAHE